MADTDDETAPWTVKAMRVRTREKAVRYAKMAGVTMAEWLEGAVETRANQQDGNQVIPPATPPATMESALAAIDQGFKTAAMLQAMTAAHSAGLPVSVLAVRDTVKVMRAQVREAGGLPALKGRQTVRKIGQTISQDQAEPRPEEAA
jgi:hypothetical protein